MQNKTLKGSKLYKKVLIERNYSKRSENSKKLQKLKKIKISSVWRIRNLK